MKKRCRLFLFIGISFILSDCTFVKVIQDTDFIVRDNKAYIFCFLYQDFLKSTTILLKNNDTDEFVDISEFSNSGELVLLELEPGQYQLSMVYASTFGSSYTYKIPEELRWPFDLKPGEILYFGEFYAKSTLIISFKDFEQNTDELLSRYRSIRKTKIGIVSF